MRTGITLAVLLPFLLHVWGVAEIRLITQLENFAYDARVRLTAPGPGRSEVVVIDVDERSIRLLEQWPWSRDHLADLVDRSFDQYGVRALGFDMAFPEPDRGTGEQVMRALAMGELADDERFLQAYESIAPKLRTDERFADALRGRAVVLGFVFRQHAVAGTENEIAALPAPLIPGERLAPAMRFLQPEAYTGNLELLQRSARNGGFFDNATVDQDGVFRRVPMLQQYKGDVYGALALELVRAARGWAPLEFVFAKDSPIHDNLHLDHLRVDDLRIPVDYDLALYVPYRGTSFTLPYVSAIDVINGTADPALLRDKVALVGTSAPGLLDMRVTPVEESFVGVEVHANIVDGILQQRVKFHPPYMLGAHWTLLILLAVIVTAIMVRWSVVPATAATLILLGVLVVGNLVLWQVYDFIVPLAPSLLFVIGAFVLHILYGLLVESRGKRYLSQMFGQYVPPELVEEMDRSRQEISLEGESREMSVLFSDVRGFTNLSEGLDPKQLTRLMNEFLTPLTRVIHEHRGTIDKYMGDAIMAFWGAPLPDEEHASHAVGAALDMVSVMRRLGPEFRAKGWPELRIGVGVNTGLMNVGNMGSEFRMAYTVLGDAVNLGSRLEGLTKAYGVDIVVSESTRDAAPEFVYIELDRVRVKGKAEAVSIFEPLGRRDELPKESRQLRARHKQALRLYREREWDAAEREFFALAQAEPDRAVYRIYLDRIAHFRQHPPPVDWDGVFTFATK